MTTTTARLDLRLSARDKSRIARAAALRGMPVATLCAIPCCARWMRPSQPRAPPCCLTKNRADFWQLWMRRLLPTSACSTPCRQPLNCNRVEQRLLQWHCTLPCSTASSMTARAFLVALPRWMTTCTNGQGNTSAMALPPPMY